jgi:hypothetical protein
MYLFGSGMNGGESPLFRPSSVCSESDIPNIQWLISVFVYGFVAKYVSLQGINTRRVEAMEKQLKRDVLAEVHTGRNRSVKSKYTDTVLYLH